MIAHSHKQVTLDHQKLNYYVSKRKKAQATLVLLHGVFSTHKFFYPLIEKLDNDFNIIALDLPGFGDSTADGIFQPGDLPALLQKFIAKLKLKDIYLLGVSLGGIYSILYAAQYPDTIKGIILIETPIKSRFIGKAYLNIINLVKNVKVLKVIVSRKDSPLVRGIITFAMALPDVKYLEQHKTELIQEVVSKTNYDLLAKYCQYLVDFDVSVQLNQIKLPILALYGGKDYVCLAKCAPEVKVLNSRAEVHIFPFFTHNAHINKTHLISELLLEYFHGNQQKYNNFVIIH